MTTRLADSLLSGADLGDVRGLSAAVRSNILNRVDARRRLIAVKTPLGHGFTKPDRSGTWYERFVP